MPKIITVIRHFTIVGHVLNMQGIVLLAADLIYTLLVLVSTTVVSTYNDSILLGKN